MSTERSRPTHANNGGSPSVPRRELISWAVYDWANSAFPTVIQTFLFAAYFTRQVAADHTTGTTQWGVAIGVAGVVVAFGGPLLGAVADQTGRRKPALAALTLLCSAATAGLWFVQPSTDFVWLALVLVAIGTIGSEYANVLYNAMLPELAPPDEVGRWSGWAWGLGYAGGLACLAVALVGFVGFGGDDLDAAEANAASIRATAFLVAGWYVVFALPLFLVTRDTPSKGKPLSRAVADGWRRLIDTVRHVRQYAALVRFLIAHLVYTDGLASLFAMGGVYAVGTFGMTESEVLLFGIALNVTAALGAVAFGWIDDWIGGKRTIVLSLIGLIIPGTAVLLVESKPLFWGFCLVLGIFVGPVQAASRSYLARVAPPELRNQAFGLYALSGKATAFQGPLLVGGLTWLSGSQRVGMSAIVVLFLVGLILMLTVPAAGDEHAGGTGESKR